MIMMWSEKYRPTKLAECVLSHLQPSEATFLDVSVESGMLPNLLFFGSPGTGKTTIATILCDDEKYSVRQFNGSLLGKEDVAKIGRMLTTRSLFHENRCIWIDEVDGMTHDGQRALRAMIEENVTYISWIFTANMRSSIIEPLQSRMICIDCSVSELSKRRLHIDGIVKRCESVLQSECVTNYPIDDIRKLVELHYPDIRQTLNQLQVRYARSLAA